ncbi:hypothetical protein HX773_24450 [Pantoea sp. B9002]|uniref:hypothetical protein n=1 Tax=Pantoea sp. B9002 TaxID=2726979 RepID=UPI0015A1494E|nr:hypothetical protein [Pantoea sp. B9002]NWA64052.1 hypothetical protein [Pantoea sp. B9002]
MLRLIVSEQDYIFSQTVEAYVLPEREMGPGNPASSPAEGASIYNAWIANGCPGSDKLNDFESMINHALSDRPEGGAIACYLLNVMAGTAEAEPLPECRWTMQLVFAKDTLDRMDRTSFLRLRNTLMMKVRDYE